MQAYTMQFYPGKQVDTSKQHCLTHVPEALHTSNMQVLSQLLSTNRLQLCGGFRLSQPPTLSLISWRKPHDQTTGHGHTLFGHQGGGPTFNNHKSLHDKRKQEPIFSSLSFNIQVCQHQLLSRIKLTQALYASLSPPLKYSQHHLTLSSWGGWQALGTSTR